MGAPIIESALVVGASGQLGSRIVEDLENRGVLVYVSSRSLLNHPNFVEFENLELLRNPHRVDLIVNAAGPSSSAAMEDPIATFEWARTHSELLIKLSRRNPTATCVSFSTVHVYSPDPMGTITEDSETRSHHPYGQAHSILEQGLLRSGRWALLRLSNVVGPHGILGKPDPNLVANSLLFGALANKQLELNSNPGIRRDFLPATNLINALLLLVELRGKGVFNLSAGKTTTLGSLVTVLAEEWQTQTGVSLPLVFESQEIHVPDFCFSHEKIVSLGLKMDLDLRRELGILVASVLRGQH